MKITMTKSNPSYHRKPPFSNTGPLESLTHNFIQFFLPTCTHEKTSFRWCLPHSDCLWFQNSIEEDEEELGGGEGAGNQSLASLLEEFSGNYEGEPREELPLGLALLLHRLPNFTSFVVVFLLHFICILLPLLCWVVSNCPFCVCVEFEGPRRQIFILCIIMNNLEEEKNIDFFLFFFSIYQFWIILLNLKNVEKDLGSSWAAQSSQDKGRGLQVVKR